MDITQFFEAMPTPQRVLWYIAIPSTIVFGFMMIMTFLGLDGTDGVDTDLDTDVDDASDAFQIWTFRNLIIFLSIFSWSAISFLNNNVSFAWTAVYSLVLATAVVVLLTSLFFFMHKLQQDNTPRISEILNKPALVYLTVPEKGTGMGKINVTYGGALREVNAVSMNRNFKTGEQVKVVDLQGDLAFIDELNK